MKFSRQILMLFLTALMFITSTGMTVNLHFCSEKLQNVSVNQHVSNRNKGVAKSSCKDRALITKEDACCKDQQIKAKNPVKTDPSKSKEQSSFVKSLVSLKNYIVDFFSFEADDDKDDEKPDLSLLPLLKEGLHILLGQFRN